MTGFIPAAPPRFRRRLAPLKALRVARRNLIAVWPDEAFAARFLAQRFLFRWLFVANDPESVRQVMVANSDNYGKSRQMQRALRPLIGDGMFIANGETWRRSRRMALPAFHHTRIRLFAEVMARTAQEMRERWDRQAPGAELDIAAEMTRVTAEVVCRTMFSDDLGEERAAVVFEGFDAYQDTLSQVDFGELLGLPSWWPRRPAWRARRAAAAIHGVLDEIIAARRAAGAATRNDLLGMLLEARDEDGSPMSARQIRDEVAVIFLAGHETTASALSWAWYLLSQHPEAEAKLHEEVDRVLGGRAPGYDDVPSLTYTRWVFDEALRLYPPVAVFSREAQTADTIRGRQIPSGAMVLVVPWLLHRHKSLWRNPDAFEPERFSPERSEGRPKHAYVPFGAGPRTCLGANFALAEGVIILATVAQRYRLALRPGHVVEPVCRLSLRPRDGLPMRLEPR